MSWELLSCEEVSSGYALRHTKLTLRRRRSNESGDDDGNLPRADQLDAEVEETATGHKFKLLRLDSETGWDGGAEEGGVLFEHECGFLVGVEATKIVLKRNKVIYLRRAGGGRIAVCMPLRGRTKQQKNQAPLTKPFNLEP
jgi:hypothetical protein